MAATLFLLVATATAQSPVFLCDCADTPSQVWDLSNVGSGQNTVIYQKASNKSNAANHTCMTFQNETLVMNPCGVLATCGPRERWSFGGKVLPDIQWMGDPVTKSCLRARGLKSGEELTHGVCDGGPNQFFLYASAGGDSPDHIVNPEMTLCLSSTPCT